MIAQAQKSAQNLIEIVVSNFTSYNDEAEFHGQKGTDWEIFHVTVTKSDYSFNS